MAVRTIEQIINTINNYAILVINEGLPLEKIILFGSYSKGNQKDDSDVDIAVVLKKFTEDKFTTRLKLLKLGRQFEEVIEPHPFLANEFNNNDPFASEIIKTGLVLYS
jgi:predicted nucleotidyltransferase